MNWLTKLAESDDNSEQLLQEAINSLSPDDLLDLAVYNGVIPPLDALDTINEKIASVERMGRELAYSHGNALEKEAIAPLIGMAAKGLAGGLATGAVKGLVSGGAKNVTNTASGAYGAFKYAHEKTALLPGAGTMGQKLVGMAVRNPTAALAAGGAVGGALMAPRDPQTGQKHYLRGALTGAAVGTGAGMIGGGKLRHAVLNRKSPLLGEGVANYARQATKATSPAANKALAAGTAAPAAPVASSAPAAAPPQGTWGGVPRLEKSMLAPIEGGPSAGAGTMYMGGPVAGKPQMAASAPKPMAASARQPLIPNDIPPDFNRAGNAGMQGALQKMYGDFQPGGKHNIVPGVPPRPKRSPASKDVLLNDQEKYLNVLQDKNPKGFEGLQRRWAEKSAPAPKSDPGTIKLKKSPIEAGNDAMGDRTEALKPAMDKRASLVGGLAGYSAAGPDREASPRSGFWRGFGGGLAGGMAGGALGGAAGRFVNNPKARLALVAGGSLAGQVGGGILAGRTAAPNPKELRAHRASQLAHAKEMAKEAWLGGGLAGHMAAGPDRDASPRSGFWRGAGGGLLGGIAGAGLGAAAGRFTSNPMARAALVGGGAIAGELGGGILAGRTAAPNPQELKAYRAAQLAKAQELAKEAFVDQVVGGFIGHHKGKQQKARGESHSFGGKQVASLLVPGGAGYQLGRYIAHNKKDNA